MRAVLAATSKHTQARTSEYPTPSSNSLGQRFATSTTALCARDVCETRKPGKRNKVNTAYSSVKRVPEMSNPRKFEMLGCVVMSLYVPSNVMLKHPPMSTLCTRWVRQTMRHQHRQCHPHLKRRPMLNHGINGLVRDHTATTQFDGAQTGTRLEHRFDITIHDEKAAGDVNGL